MGTISLRSDNFPSQVAVEAIIEESLCFLVKWECPRGRDIVVVIDDGVVIVDIKSHKYENGGRLCFCSVFWAADVRCQSLSMKGRAAIFDNQNSRIAWA